MREWPLQIGAVVYIHGNGGSSGTRRNVYGAVVVGKRIVLFKYFYGVLCTRGWRMPAGKEREFLQSPDPPPGD